MALAAVTVNQDLINAVNQYDSWLSKQVIPKWANYGVTSEGAAIERFLYNGDVDQNANKRIRVQARQMFAFTYAHKNNWIKNGPELVQRIESFLNKNTNSPIRGFYPHVLDASNSVLFSHRDLYDCAFFLLAYGWRYHVFNDLNALSNAQRLIEEVEFSLKRIKSGWGEGTLNTDMRRQNPHMHLFEAFLTLYEFTRDGRWLAYAGEMFSLFETIFFDNNHKVVREFFDPDWQLNAVKGHIVEPGHMMEWIWLLLQYNKYTKKPVIEYCTALYKQAMSIGLDEGACILFDEVRPTGEILKSTKRCWPMTEWVKAALALAEVSDTKSDYEAHASWALNILLSKYRNTMHPSLYIDQLDANNQPLETHAPASTLYHLLMAHSEAKSYVG